MLKKLTMNLLVLTMMLVLTSSDLLAQTRISFRRGRSSATVSHTIGRDAVQTYVLSAREGKTLYAKIRSNNGKVFLVDDGATEIIKITDDGDNSFEVYNTGGATRFTLTVSIR
jgi:hypothetical protein